MLASAADIVNAAVAAGLEDTLRGDGPFTVFAPKDAASAKLPDGTLENLLLPGPRDGVPVPRPPPGNVRKHLFSRRSVRSRVTVAKLTLASD
ncbi:MAG: hypothetical protein CMQ34_01310 [Gammaproteobacteria bacterium]|nr:hypothetical protein [Gammaproteobacteria bacterium]